MASLQGIECILPAGVAVFGKDCGLGQGLLRIVDLTRHAAPVPERAIFQRFMIKGNGMVDHKIVVFSGKRQEKKKDKKES